MARLDDALAVRRSALLALRALGTKKLTPKLGMCLGWSGEGLTILFRTPYQTLARPTARWVIEAAIQGVQVQPQLPYGLDIWADGDGKVANITWGDQEQFQIVTFKRGPWQEQLENICAREVLAKVPGVCAAQTGA